MKLTRKNPFRHDSNNCPSHHNTDNTDLTHNFYPKVLTSSSVLSSHTAHKKELITFAQKSSYQLVRKLQGLVVAISKEHEECGRRRRRSRPMRSQRIGRGRFGMRGRRREERRAKVEVWSSGDGRGEREAGRALGCLGFWSAMLLHSVCEWLLHTLR